MLKLIQTIHLIRGKISLFVCLFLFVFWYFWNLQWQMFWFFDFYKFQEAFCNFPLFLSYYFFKIVLIFVFFTVKISDFFFLSIIGFIDLFFLSIIGFIDFSQSFDLEISFHFFFVWFFRFYFGCLTKLQKCTMYFY